MITLNQQLYKKPRAILTNGKSVKVTDQSLERLFKLWESGKLKVSSQTGNIYNLTTTFERFN